MVEKCGGVVGNQRKKLLAVGFLSMKQRKTKMKKRKKMTKIKPDINTISVIVAKKLDIKHQSVIKILTSDLTMILQMKIKDSSIKKIIRR
jgi:hypothetical protein